MLNTTEICDFSGTVNLALKNFFLNSLSPEQKQHFDLENAVHYYIS